MAFWDSLIGAVNNYFNPKPVSSNTVPWSQISSSLGNQPVNFSNVTNRGGTVSGSSSRVAPQGGYATKSQVSSINAPSGSQRGVDVQGGSYSGGGGVPTQTNLPPPFVPPPSPELKPTNIQSAISNLAKTVAPMVSSISPEIGKAGKALTSVGTALNAPQIVPGGLGAKAQSWAGFQQAIEEAKKGGFLGQLPEAFSQYSQQAGNIKPEDVWSLFGNIVSRIQNPQQAIFAQPSLWQYLSGRGTPLPPTAPTGTPEALPGVSTKSGEILPTAAKTGAPQAAPKGIMPSSTPTPRAGVVPSAISPAALPANMRNLSTTNVNPAVASAITPQAIQSIGQLLLQSLLGNQSGLTGITPGLAQALWGAPTSSSPFGGYEGGAAVPSQTSIEQPKNIPPLPQPLQQG